ncbi:MAG TPA: hydroxymethylglutaryl-CoA lyase [Stellaceae bacterium]|nr:hydroxymethylglutaryl-CoA lyase [Stellaceae bacterium]
MSEQAFVREVGLRDGLQNIARFVPTNVKIAWIEAEHAAGVREIEVASLVPPKLIPQFIDAEEVIRFALSQPGLTVAVLIPNLKGAERAIALGAHKMNYVLSVSEAHNRANVRRTTADSVADFKRVLVARDAVAPARRPKAVCGLATAFGCTIQGHVDEDTVRRIAAEVAEAGADELTIADTVGYAGPKAVSRVFRAVLAEVGNIPVAAHFHDTRGLGLANVSAALDAGVRTFDASLAGLGGCPYAPGASGNIVTEDLAFLLESMGFATGVDFAKLIEVRDIVHRAVPEAALLGNLPKAGLPKNFTPTSLVA